MAKKRSAAKKPTRKTASLPRRISEEQARNDMGRVYPKVSSKGVVYWVAELFGVRVRRRTEAGARAVLAVLEAKCQGYSVQMPSLSPDGENVTLKQLYSRWLREVSTEWRPRTVKTVGEYSRILLSRLGHVKVFEVDVEMIRKWIARCRKENVGSSRVRSAFTLLRRLLDHALREKLVHLNAARFVPVPKHEPSPLEVYTTEEVAKLLASGMDRRETLWVATLFHLGIRLGELLGLRWEDVDITRGTISIRRQAIDRSNIKIRVGTYKNFPNRCAPLKSKKAMRDLQMTPYLWNLYADYVRRYRRAVERKNVMPPGFIIPGDPPGVPRERVKLAKQWQRLHRRAKVRYRRLHMARHTAATYALNAGAALPAVAAMMGHASTTTTLANYVHCVDGAKKQVADALGRAYSSTEAKNGNPQAQPPEGMHDMLPREVDRVLPDLGTDEEDRCLHDVREIQELTQAQNRQVSEADVGERICQQEDAPRVGGVG